ncbi:adenylosuccinate lyase [Robiginitalea myxolifaciens]|uniref:Adenylosuccinate lyase n=1 Tax=Robiginitalea myxolifaciens TaxID=400055 RepID=A0A1I6FMN8_9FLAO|nr:adenylosuccinate lyase [Robiginitalea myxolifaciens]SFR31200.1 adenylosuccinate lyase [Robiginitalea myxolifaciens]
MNFDALSAISPIDGRYRSKAEPLADYFSEAALIKYRLQIEVEYFIALCELPLPQLSDFPKAKWEDLRAIYRGFDLDDARAIKEIEKTTNHDVKAVEYHLKNQFDSLGLQPYKEFIHFGLTSQDINNTAIPLSLTEGINACYVPRYQELLQKIEALAKEWQNVPMLARTHGQPASPTRLGKEIQVFVVRLKEQFDLLNDVPSAAKFGGATGNFNAHAIAYPDIDWQEFGRNFVQEKLGLHYSFPTTQIEHYDHMAALFHGLSRINTVLIDLNRDFWSYISMDYFKQQIKAGEVGSSAMPHKVNPIDFENSEGNLGVANALFGHLAAKLPVSRLQRDLTDSTVLRNIGVPLAHTIISLEATLKGLNKLLLNADKIEADLEGNWAVLAEAIQTILRREGYPNPYEALKGLTRTNSKITEETLNVFINDLDISENIKAELRALRPENYTGI